MTDVVVIEKNGTIKQSTCKDINALYKCCGFRKTEGFDLQHTWEDVNVNGLKYNLSVYSRTDGKANTENKYDMPPPIDNALYFGNIAIINQTKKGEMIGITVEEWNKIYEFMFGGFENLDDFDDENEEDELENIPAHMKTKQGYLKDNFVVDDEEEEEVADADSEESEEMPEDEDADAHEDEESGSESGAEGESDTEDSDIDESDDDSESTNSELVIEDYEYSDDE